MKKIEDLQFICPSCNRTILEIVEETYIVYSVVNISLDGKLKYNKDEDNLGSLGAVDTKNVHYRCKYCQFKLRNRRHKIITTQKQVSEWCKNNVPAPIPMPTKKLSATQTKAVRVMEWGGLMKPYKICPRISTLEALVKKGIVIKHVDKYHKFISPNLSWKYSLRYSLMEISHLL